MATCFIRKEKIIYRKSFESRTLGDSQQALLFDMISSPIECVRFYKGYGLGSGSGHLHLSC